MIYKKGGDILYSNESSISGYLNILEVVNKLFKVSKNRISEGIYIDGTYLGIVEESDIANDFKNLYIDGTICKVDVKIVSDVSFLNSNILGTSYFNLEGSLSQYISNFSALVCIRKDLVKHLHKGDNIQIRKVKLRVLNLDKEKPRILIANMKKNNLYLNDKSYLVKGEEVYQSKDLRYMKNIKQSLFNYYDGYNCTIKEEKSMFNGNKLPRFSMEVPYIYKDIKPVENKDYKDLKEEVIKQMSKANFSMKENAEEINRYTYVTDILFSSINTLVDAYLKDVENGKVQEVDCNIMSKFLRSVLSCGEKEVELTKKYVNFESLSISKNEFVYRFLLSVLSEEDAEEVMKFENTNQSLLKKENIGLLVSNMYEYFKLNEFRVNPYLLKSAFVLNYLQYMIVDSESLSKLSLDSVIVRLCDLVFNRYYKSSESFSKAFIIRKFSNYVTNGLVIEDSFLNSLDFGANVNNCISSILVTRNTILKAIDEVERLGFVVEVGIDSEDKSFITPVFEAIRVVGVLESLDKLGKPKGIHLDRCDQDGLTIKCVDKKVSFTSVQGHKVQYKYSLDLAKNLKKAGYKKIISVPAVDLFKFLEETNEKSMKGKCAIIVLNSEITETKDLLVLLNLVNYDKLDLSVHLIGNADIPETTFAGLLKYCGGVKIEGAYGYEKDEKEIEYQNRLQDMKTSAEVLYGKSNTEYSSIKVAGYSQLSVNNYVKRYFNGDKGHLVFFGEVNERAKGIRDAIATRSGQERWLYFKDFSDRTLRYNTNRSKKVAIIIEDVVGVNEVLVGPLMFFLYEICTYYEDILLIYNKSTCDRMYVNYEYDEYFCEILYRLVKYMD